MQSIEREALQRDLARLANGERAAFEPVFAALWPVLRGFAARCLPAEEADDAAQEACLRVFSRASEFDRGRDALSWVLGIAAYEIRSARQRRRRRSRRETPLDGAAGGAFGGGGAGAGAGSRADAGRAAAAAGAAGRGAGAALASGEPSPEDRAVRRDLARVLAETLALLPGHDAETLVAYARGEHPALPGATFRKRVERALRRLRAAWRLHDSCP